MDEADLVECAATGVPWDVTGRSPDDRRVDAALVVDLCLGRHGPVHPKGVQLVGATLDGPLDLASASVAAPLRLDDCRIASGVNLFEASLPVVSLRRCRIGKTLRASGLRTRRLHLLGSTLNGPLLLHGAEAETLTLDRMEIVRDHQYLAVDMWGIKVAGTLLMREARVTGAVSAHLSMIGGSLAMDATELTGTDDAGCSLDIRAAHVGADLTLRCGFKCAGVVRAMGASIGGDLDIEGATIAGADHRGVSFRGVQLRVGSSVVAGSGLVTAGAVHLHRARIDGDLALITARIGGADEDGTALAATGIHVGGGVRLNDLDSAGAVRLSDGVIDGSLTLRGAQIGGPVDRYGNSFAADGLRVGQSVHLTGGFTAMGEVRLVGATIAGQLSFEDAAPFRLLTLRGARCAELAETRWSWPAAGGLELRGFRFDALKLDTGWAQRLDWVRRQGFARWSPEPYEQLAAYYSATGDEDAARRIQVAKNDDELTHLRTTRGWRSLGFRTWRRPLGWLVGYGYRRQRAAWLLGATLLLAGMVFRQAERDGAMVPDPPLPTTTTAATPLPPPPPPCGEAYPCFNSLVYGADVVLPIVDFGQDTAYRPVETSDAGQVWIWARWTFIAVGWALASVFVAAFTGLVQRA